MKLNFYLIYLFFYLMQITFSNCYVNLLNNKNIIKHNFFKVNSQKKTYHLSQRYIEELLKKIKSNNSSNINNDHNNLNRINAFPR